LINSEKASTPHVFDEYIGRFSRFRFSMIHTHDQNTELIKMKYIRLNHKILTGNEQLTKIG
jgi:hypothetical protein